MPRVTKENPITNYVNRMEKETLLYGLPKGATERHEEVLLLSNATPEKIAKVKVMAARDGFHSFRVAEMNLSFENMVNTFKNPTRPLAAITTVRLTPKTR